MAVLTNVVETPIGLAVFVFGAALTEGLADPIFAGCTAAILCVLAVLTLAILTKARTTIAVFAARIGLVLCALLGLRVASPALAAWALRTVGRLAAFGFGVAVFSLFAVLVRIAVPDFLIGQATELTHALFRVLAVTVVVAGHASE